MKTVVYLSVFTLCAALTACEDKPAEGTPSTDLTEANKRIHQLESQIAELKRQLTASHTKPPPSDSEQRSLALEAVSTRLKRHLADSRGTASPPKVGVQSPAGTVASTVSDIGSVVSVSEEELSDALRQNEAAFYGKYAGKTIRVRTNVQWIRGDTVVLGRDSFERIWCSFDAAGRKTVESLRHDQEVTVTGVVMDYVDPPIGVRLRSCVFQ